MNMYTRPVAHAEDVQEAGTGLDLDRDVGEQIAAAVDRFFAGTVREHQRLMRKAKSRSLKPAPLRRSLAGKSWSSS